jgi:hypothetical protein
MLSSFIPIALIAFVPEGNRAALILLAAVPLTIGFGILMVKHWPRRGSERPPPRVDT